MRSSMSAAVASAAITRAFVSATRPLRSAARNAGIKVPQATIDRALRYIIESMISEQDNGPVGAFWYQPHDFATGIAFQ